MTPEHHARVKALFLEACELPEDEWSEFLRTRCDGAERAEIESLLGFHEAVPEDELTGDRGASRGSLAARTSAMPAASSASRAASGTWDAITRGGNDLDLAPGTVISERYRLASRLGRGGMGEVFLADDLVLGESVALKFLRRSDRDRTPYLVNEVRMARQVTHPNVCRVYDVGEFDGRAFISMQYVDGEDLSSLLGRIGRIPRDRTVQIARQLFSGLAAAHAKGVLHRDVKPANIMIDGRGEALLTDFGIASHLTHPDSEVATGSLAGTPAYMAPEQFREEEVTTRTDLYSLGVVLYEMCTGVYPFDASKHRQYVEAHLHQAPAPPATHIDDIDATLERVILKCLEKQPQDRPSSALAVAAALPGGDPLSLAVSVGETPSPDMVADAGSRGILPLRVAATMVGLFLLLLLSVLALADSSQRLASAGLDLPPEVLAEKARERLRQFGWPDDAKDSAYGFLSNPYAIDVVPAGAPGLPDPSAPGASTILFWYRHSPVTMKPSGLENLTVFDATIGPYDPPLKDGGSLVLLHPNGNLDHFEVRTPKDLDDDQAFGPPNAVDYDAVLAAAGLATADLEVSNEPFAPAYFADRRATWRGVTAQRPDLPLQVRMASYRDRLTYFRLLPDTSDDNESDDNGASDAGPSGRLGASGALGETALGETADGETALGETDTGKAAAEETERSRSPVVAWAITLIDEWFEWWQLLMVAAVVAAVPLMRGNVRRGRGDLRGARRLSLFFLGLNALLWAVKGPHFSNITAEWTMAQLQIGKALWQASLIWLFYLALEPYVRRTWPHSLISWTRLLNGRFSNPLVGRSVLVGAIFGTLWVLIGQVDVLLPGWLGLAYTPSTVDPTLFDNAISASSNLAAAGIALLAAVFDGIYSLLLLVLLRLLLRKPELAVAGYIFIVAILYTPSGAHEQLSWLTIGLLVSITEAIALVRYGLLSFVAAGLVYNLLTSFPLTLDMTAWYAGSGLFGPVLVLLLTAASTYYALAPRRRRDHTGDLSRYSIDT